MCGDWASGWFPAPTPQLWEVPTMSESMALVGLDVHRAQSVAAVLDPVGGELRVERLRGMPCEVVPGFLEALGRPVRAVAAGELSFAFVPSEEEERFRDLVRCIDDARKDLMRSRHRLSKFLLRRGLRFPGRAWTQPHGRWLGKLSFDDALSQAVLVDYVCAVDALVQRRRALIAVLEDAVPASSHAHTIARLRCFRGINTLTAAGLCAEVGRFERFAKPSLLSGFLGIVPCEYTSSEKRVQGAITKAGPTHARRLLVEAAHHYRRGPRVSYELAARHAGQDPRIVQIAWRAQRRLHSRWAHLGSDLSAASQPARSPSPARASWPRSAGRPRP